MPRMSQSRSSQKPSTSRKRQGDSLSQSTIEQSFSKSQKVIENVDELVNNCVRFVIYRAGNKLPIRKADIQKHVLKNVGRNFDNILNKVTEILKNVYGYDLYLSEDTGNKQYLVGNVLPYKGNTPNVQIILENEDEDLPPGVYKILIMLVLTHIFMTNNVVSEAALFNFLRTIQIDPDEQHEIFGNVKDFIASTMVKQKYLSAEVEQVSRKISYSWGPRAEHEISKHELLKFVCKIYKDRIPRSWTNQFENANAQFGQDETLQNGDEAVEVDTD